MDIFTIVSSNCYLLKLILIANEHIFLWDFVDHSDNIQIIKITDAFVWILTYFIIAYCVCTYTLSS